MQISIPDSFKCYISDRLELEERVAFGRCTVEEEMEVYLQEVMERDD